MNWTASEPVRVRQHELTLLEKTLQECKVELNQMLHSFSLNKKPLCPCSLAELNPVFSDETKSQEKEQKSTHDALQQAEQLIKYQREHLEPRESTQRSNAELSHANIIQHEQSKVNSADPSNSHAMSVMVGEGNTAVIQSTINILNIGENIGQGNNLEFCEILKSIPFPHMFSVKGGPQKLADSQISSEDTTPKIARKKPRDSVNLCLGSGSSDEPEWMRQQLLEEAQQPLPNINISPSDLPGIENVGHSQHERIPPAVQPANNREDVAHLVHSTQNPLVVQMQNTVTAPQLQASNNIQQSVFSYDNATRIPEIPSAPPRHQLELSVGYQELSCLDKKVINHRDGFLLFHAGTPDPNQLPEECQFIKFPNPSALGAGRVIPDENLMYIQRVLANLQGGLQIRCHEGNIYATRRSRAKIFYGSHDTYSKTAKLPRNHEVMIFNGIQYINTILYKYLKQENCEEVAKWLSPIIYFTFSQKWFPDTTPLKSMLVWAKIIPQEPHFIWNNFFHAEENFALCH